MYANVMEILFKLKIKSYGAIIFRFEVTRRLFQQFDIEFSYSLPTVQH